MPSESKTPEELLAIATKARGDIFPEWKPLAHASPETYRLITETGSYLHSYHGVEHTDDQLSGPMRELIAIPALCSKGDMRHSPNHIRRAYRMGLTDRAIFEGAIAFSAVVGWSNLTFVSLAIIEANNPLYPYGELRAGGEPKELKPFAEMTMGRTRKGDAPESAADTPEWRYAASIDAELVRRATAFADHCLTEGEILGPGPRELIAVAALAMRGEADLAAAHIRRAYDYGMTRRHVLEAICSVLPMSGMVTGQVGFRAMQLAER
ncbi:MAG TPA: carboxymuconolactone decarboxylase family protein [Burkholderiales bacterium]|nr:carboxymuconolactone decarboxylase family protein [Burkholderiales bacterium]